MRVNVFHYHVPVLFPSPGFCAGLSQHLRSKLPVSVFQVTTSFAAVFRFSGVCYYRHQHTCFRDQEFYNSKAKDSHSRPGHIHKISIGIASPTTCINASCGSPLFRLSKFNLDMIGIRQNSDLDWKSEHP